ncbi:MAG: 4-(cytidine 5'-diphospho)-2-C-methyl-D-erythritol kinase [Spirochaetes bacterium]|nr:4-(cytidine 5'-diphospho)-2-C-methyl-D-erythritol kinase [Spirochaetota bacterium]
MLLLKDGFKRALVDSIRADAKVNIHLEVLNRREDGYHNIFSVMASVALHDLLKLEELTVGDSRGEGPMVTVRSAGGSHTKIIEALHDHDNLIAVAARLYFESMGKGGSATFSVIKNIPAGAGLGGGSSDAAAALKLLNARLSAFKPEDLTSMASRIGADVPYCLQGGFAVCRGIGDIVTPIPAKKNAAVLIANPDIHVDTGSAYRALKRESKIDPAREVAIGKRTRELASVLSRGAFRELRSVAVNDFEKPVFRLHPGIGEMKEMLYGLGADFASMTGSGSSVIAIFHDAGKARSARGQIEKTGAEVILTKFA